MFLRTLAFLAMFIAAPVLANSDPEPATDEDGWVMDADGLGGNVKRAGETSVFNSRVMDQPLSTTGWVFDDRANLLYACDAGKTDCVALTCVNGTKYLALTDPGNRNTWTRFWRLEMGYEVPEKTPFKPINSEKSAALEKYFRKPVDLYPLGKMKELINLDQDKINIGFSRNDIQQFDSLNIFYYELPIQKNAASMLKIFSSCLN